MRALALLLLIPAAASPATGNTPKEFAEAIYRRLARVTGDGRQAPPLEIIPEGKRTSDRQVAWFDPRNRTIGMDEKAIKLCQQSAGARAEGCVGFFLGHELAHFYKDHGWGGDFGSRFSATPLGEGIQKLTVQQRLTFETQADDLGGIYGFLAGYDSLGAAPEALKRIYKEYAIPAASPDYPSLEERQQIARKSQNSLNRFVPLFEAGNLLFVIGRYRDAAACFDQIAASFPSREILNNAGIAAALASGTPDIESYPWLLDSETRLRPPARSRTLETPTEAERRELLDSAHTRLEDAIRRDPDYLPAVINLALVNDLVGRQGTAADDAAHALEMAKRFGSEEAARIAHVARAIASIHRGDLKMAEADLAAAGDDPAAAYWKAIAAGQPAPRKGRDAGQKPGPDETIAGKRPGGVNPNAQSISMPPRLKIWSSGSPQYLELHVAASPGGHLRAIVTRDYDQPMVRGVARGANVSSVKEAYGEPSRLHHTASGGWYVYERAGVVARFDPAGALEGWTVYAWEEQ